MSRTSRCANKLSIAPTRGTTLWRGDTMLRLYSRTSCAAGHRAAPERDERPRPSRRDKSIAPPAAPGRTLSIREVDAGSQRLRDRDPSLGKRPLRPGAIRASLRRLARHADVLPRHRAVTTNMRRGARRTYEATPHPSGSSRSANRALRARRRVCGSSACAGGRVVGLAVDFTFPAALLRRSPPQASSPFSSALKASGELASTGIRRQ